MLNLVRAGPCLLKLVRVGLSLLKLIWAIRYLLNLVWDCCLSIGGRDSGAALVHDGRGHNLYGRACGDSLVHYSSDAD